MSMATEWGNLRNQMRPDPSDRLVFLRESKASEDLGYVGERWYTYLFSINFDLAWYPKIPCLTPNAPAGNIDIEAWAVERDPYLAAFLRESAAFERLLPALLDVVPGRFVAVLDGRVIDQDEDEFSLAERVIGHYPKRFVLIRRVSRESFEEYLESPELETP